MLRTSRRDLILSAAVAGAALGLDKSLALVAPTESERTPAGRSQNKPIARVKKAHTPDPKPGFRRYKVGDAEITALYDGIWEKVHDAKYFGNATVAEVKQALADAGLTTAFVPIPITVFVVKLNGKLILCDAGGGNQVQAFNPNSVFTSGKMMVNMKAAGIDPKAIETILVSHFILITSLGCSRKRPTPRFSPMRKSLCRRPNTSGGPIHRSSPACLRGAGRLPTAFRL